MTEEFDLRSPVGQPECPQVLFPCRQTVTITVLFNKVLRKTKMISCRGFQPISFLRELEIQRVVFKNPSPPSRIDLSFIQNSILYCKYFPVSTKFYLKKNFFRQLVLLLDSYFFHFLSTLPVFVLFSVRLFILVTLFWLNIRLKKKKEKTWKWIGRGKGDFETGNLKKGILTYTTCIIDITYPT